jgi:hypothetical protein
MTIQQLAAHAADLAKKHRVELILDPTMRAGDASSTQIPFHDAVMMVTGLIDRDRLASLFSPDAPIKLVHARPITDETSYAVVMHEMGHQVAPRGTCSCRMTRHNSTWHEYLNAKLEEETVAWQWARDNTSDWTPTMAQVEQYCYATYERGVANVWGLEPPVDKEGAPCLAA